MLFILFLGNYDCLLTFSDVLLFSGNPIGQLNLSYGSHTVLATWRLRLWSPVVVIRNHNLRPCPHDSLKFTFWNWSASATVVDSAP